MEQYTVPEKSADPEIEVVAENPVKPKGKTTRIIRTKECLKGERVEDFFAAAAAAKSTTAEKEPVVENIFVTNTTTTADEIHLGTL